MCICGRRNCSECGPGWEVTLDVQVVRDARRGDKESKDELAYRNSIKKSLGIDIHMPLIIVCYSRHIVRIDDEIKGGRLSLNMARKLKDGDNIICRWCSAKAPVEILRY